MKRKSTLPSESYGKALRREQTESLTGIETEPAKSAQADRQVANKLNPSQGLKLLLMLTLKLLLLRREQTESLTGIETEARREQVNVNERCREQTESLTGIETSVKEYKKVLFEAVANKLNPSQGLKP